MNNTPAWNMEDILVALKEAMRMKRDEINDCDERIRDASFAALRYRILELNAEAIGFQADYDSHRKAAMFGIRQEADRKAHLEREFAALNQLLENRLGPMATNLEALATEITNILVEAKNR